MKLHKPAIASCVFTILLVAQIRGSVSPDPVHLRTRRVESAYYKTYEACRNIYWLQSLFKRRSFCIFRLGPTVLWLTYFLALTFTACRNNYVLE